MKRAVLVLIVAMLSQAALANTRKVAKVYSGDLIEIEGGFTVRLLGITVPEKSTPLGYQVFDFTKRRLEGRVVKLFTYTTDNTAAGIVYNAEGQAYAQIVTGKGPVSRLWNTNFNELLLEKGYAKVNHDMLPEECEHFLEIERRARANRVGLWKNP